MSPLEVGVAVVIAVGIVGVVVPLLPGTLLVVAAILVWALDQGSLAGWVVLAVATAIALTGVVTKYAVPGQRLRSAGVPGSTLVVGGLLGVVGFFVIPVLGLLVGFVLGVYLAEVRRVGRAAAWPATTQALRAAGLSLLIELTAALLAAVTWVAGVVVT